tara:strand:- start:60 stop:233 length:174 start_codon:yes stop_codon:yes gene_type:complete
MEQKRLWNFLIEDLTKLEQDIKKNDTENIEMFFSYWEQHIKQLKDWGLNTKLITKTK